MSLLRGSLAAAQLARQAGPSSFRLQQRNSSYWSKPDPEGHSSIWKPVSFVGGPLLGLLIIYTLAKMQHSHAEKPDFKYFRIRNKQFPWGPNGLFEGEHHDSH